MKWVGDLRGRTSHWWEEGMLHLEGQTTLYHLLFSSPAPAG